MNISDEVFACLMCFLLQFRQETQKHLEKQKKEFLCLLKERRIRLASRPFYKMKRSSQEAFNIQDCDPIERGQNWRRKKIIYIVRFV